MTYTRETPNQKNKNKKQKKQKTKNKNKNKKVTETRNMKTIIGSHPMKMVVERGL
jgi:hypothetical protein